MTAPVEKTLNPLFLTLAVLSAIPTLVFAASMFTGGNQITAFLAAWSGMWVWVWYAMAKRH